VYINNMPLKRLPILWGIVSVFLLLYSYTQIDLNLTISSVTVWQSIQKFFQYIGYFDRPLSTYLYSALLIFLFTLYLYTLKIIRDKKITKKVFITSVVVISGILFFSYNAFSYDFFNYIFDAKIVTHYHQNPYEHKALDYPSDPMLNFMRWTHRYYPYGPIWLAMTVLLSFIGANIFVVTYFLFKILIVASYIGTTYMLMKISDKEHNGTLLIPAFFAFNPLVIIETVVSGHNDTIMMFFAIASLYVAMKKRIVFSVILLLLSIGIKFATAFIVPLYFISTYLSTKLKKEYVYYGYVLFMAGAIVAAVIRSAGVYQPWYLLFVLPFTALVAHHKRIIYPLILFSAISLANYIPFLYSGNWDPPIPTILTMLNLYGVVASVILGIVLTSWEKRKGYTV